VIIVGSNSETEPPDDDPELISTTYSKKFERPEGVTPVSTLKTADFRTVLQGTRNGTTSLAVLLNFVGSDPELQQGMIDYYAGILGLPLPSGGDDRLRNRFTIFSNQEGLGDARNLILSIVRMPGKGEEAISFLRDLFEAKNAELVPNAAKTNAVARIRLESRRITANPERVEEPVSSTRHVESQIVILATALIDQMKDGGYRPLFVDAYDVDHERLIVNQGVFEISDKETQRLFDVMLPAIINAQVETPYFIVKLMVSGQVHAFGVSEETGQIGHL